MSSLYGIDLDRKEEQVGKAGPDIVVRYVCVEGEWILRFEEAPCQQ